MKLFKCMKARRECATPMRWWDLAALSGILVGPAIATSTQMLLGTGVAAPEPTVTEFDSGQNWGALAQQSAQLLAGFGYIYLRNIKLIPWSIKPTVRGTLLGVGLFAAAGLVFDLAFQAYDQLTTAEATETNETGHYAGGIDVSLVAYSLFNGFYEEFLFLVIFLSLMTKHQGALLAASVAVRIAFHTYQGLFNALLIGAVFGVGFHVLATRFPRQRIYPFAVAHALGDLLGVGLLSLLPCR